MTSPIVAVRGQSTREVDPEIADFSVTVEARDKDRATTLSRLSERVAAIRTVLDGYASAIEKRETSRLSVYAQTKGSGERISAYVGTAMTQVTVTDLDVVGEMMLRISEVPQTSVNGPFWSLRPGSPVYREARHAAIADAVTRAKEYAEALGARVIGLVELTDDGMAESSMNRPRLFRALAMQGGAESAPELDLDPQRQQIGGRVEGRFLISNPSILDDPLD